MAIGAAAGAWAMTAWGVSATIGGMIAGAVTGAIVGAVVGGVAAAVTGGNILEGVLFGAIGGAIGGAVIGAINPAAFGVGGGMTGAEQVAVAGKVAQDGSYGVLASQGAQTPTGFVQSAATLPGSGGGTGGGLGGVMTGVKDVAGQQVIGKGLESGLAYLMAPEVDEDAMHQRQLEIIEAEKNAQIDIIRNSPGPAGSQQLASTLAKNKHDWETMLKAWEREDQQLAKRSQHAKNLKTGSKVTKAQSEGQIEVAEATAPESQGVLEKEVQPEEATA